MLIYQDFGGKEWKSLSWNQVSATVKQVSNALLNLGVKPQENIGIFSQNSVQYIECDFGAWGIRAVTIPFYATSSEQQIQFMVNDAKSVNRSSTKRLVVRSHSVLHWSVSSSTIPWCISLHTIPTPFISTIS